MTYDPNRPTTYGSTERELDKNVDQAHDTIDRVADKAHTAADNAADKAEEFARDIKDKAQEIGDQAAAKANNATTTVGEKMSDAAYTLRQKAPNSGPLADAADTAADTLDRAGSYLQQQDLSQMRGDLENLIRQHPIESLLIGVGAGYLLARSMRR